MNQKKSSKVFPPGRLLLEELEQRGWSQADFAHIIGRPARVVNEIVKARRAITPETALAFSGAFGTDAEFWMNMESAYQLSRVHIEIGPIAHRARIYERFPIREMQRRGWIPTTTNLEKLERSVTEFLGVNSLEAPTNTYHAAKRTSYAEELSPLQEVWCARARHISRHVKVGRYQESHFQNLWVQLKALTHVVEDAERVSEILSRAGIRFVVVEAISGSKIDGACFWLSAHEPVVALSLRYDRHDMFWHTLFHELDHIEHGEGKGDGLIDRDLFKTGDSKPAIEVRANNNAADKLVPNKEILAFIHAANNSYSEHKLVSFAQRMNVHPGIVVGQLQHRDCIPWSSYNFLKSKIRPVLTQHALTDGFGLVIK